MTDKTVMKIDSPFVTWKDRFAEDFRFSPGLWVASLGTSFTAIFFKFVGKLPMRLYWLTQHFFVNGMAVFKSEPESAAPSGQSSKRSKKQDSFGTKAGVWGGILLLRILDLVSIGEILNFIEHIFKVNTRPLTEEEIVEAKRVFGDSLDYWRIRIDEWSLIAHFGAYSYQKKVRKPASHMAMTFYNTIHFSRRIDAEPGNSDMAWLIHELTHTAQNEHTGGGFWVESLIAQGKEGYNYGGPPALAGKDLKDFNREQQGDIAKDYYCVITNKKAVTETERSDYERMIVQLQAGKL
jgi:hypothetical protein